MRHCGTCIGRVRAPAPEGLRERETSNRCGLVWVVQTSEVTWLVWMVRQVQSTGYDKAGQPLRTHQKDLPDGFYVMIKSAERDVWRPPRFECV